MDSGCGTGVATDSGYLSFSVLFCFGISIRTVEVNSSGEEFPVTAMFRSHFFPSDESCRIWKLASELHMTCTEWDQQLRVVTWLGTLG